HNKRSHSEALFNKAVEAGSLTKVGCRFRACPSFSAIHLIDSISGPVTFKTFAGLSQCSKLRMAISFASLCQITLTLLVRISTGWLLYTCLAISNTTP